MKYYDENSNREYFLEVKVKYSKNLFNLYKDLPFLPERNKILKFHKLVSNIHGKENCCSYESVKTNIKSSTDTKKGHKVI